MYKVGDPVDYIFMGKKYTGNIIDLGNSRLVPNYFKLDKLHNGKNRINANDVIPSPIDKIKERIERWKHNQAPYCGRNDLEGMELYDSWQLRIEDYEWFLKELGEE